MLANLLIIHLTLRPRFLNSLLLDILVEPSKHQLNQHLYEGRDEADAQKGKGEGDIFKAQGDGVTDAAEI